MIGRRVTSWLALASALLAASTGGCGSILDYPEPGAEDSAAACSNGVDDDFDGRVDCRDPECASHCVEDSAALCANGLDDDGDGAIDCRDADCKAFCPESGASACADGLDDDFDGRVDCDDPDCDGFCTESDTKRCGDGRDNDGDGVRDAEDPRCWAFAAPLASSCATSERLDVGAHFDRDVGDWTFFGTYQPPPVKGSPTTPARAAVASSAAPPDRPERGDRALTFAIDATVPAIDSYWYSPDGGVISSYRVGGPWDGFALEFSARFVEHTSVSVSLVPTAAVKAGTAPPSDLASTLVGVTLDARGAPSLSLRTGGADVKVPVTLTPAGTLCASPLGGLYCDGGWVRVVVRGRGDSIVATVSGATQAEARAARPAQDLAPPAFVVVRGTSAGARFSPGATSYVAEYDAFVDDLAVHFPAASPCGADVPQLPFGDGERCGSDTSTPAATGASVSIASGPSAHCALATREASVASYVSIDGLAWTGGGAGGAADAGASEGVLDPEPGAAVVGAGVAYDAKSARFHAAIVSRGARSATLFASSSADCAKWAAPIAAAELPTDAEAPSVLVDPTTGSLTVLYTRPPADVVGRTVWRLTSTDGQTFRGDAAPLAELPADFFALAPVSFSRVGARDLVATFARAPLSGAPGLAFAIASDAEGRSWTKVGAAAVLAPTGRVATFDADELVSGSLAWPSGNRGLLLYGARGPRFAALGSTVSPLTAGTTFVRSASDVFGDATDGGADAGDASSDAGATVAATCGDGTCAANESCASCEIDCACAGTTLVQERVDDASAWTSTTSSAIYFDRQADAIATGPSSSSSPTVERVLPSPIDGDFELEFTMRVVPSATSSSGGTSAYCRLAVGLASTAGSPYSGQYAPGAYFVVGNTCGSQPYGKLPSQFAVTALAARQAAPVDYGACDGPALPNRQGLYRARLRREAGVVSATFEDPRGCARGGGVAATHAYVGALPPLDRLVAVQTQGCGAADFVFDDFVVRRLHDPVSCPAGDELCGGACTDPRTTPEHCGGCDVRCGASESCGGGECLCPAGQTKCDGACFDLTNDARHCGDCARSCTYAEVCNVAACVPVCAPGATIHAFPQQGGTVRVPVELALDNSPCGALGSPFGVFVWTPAKSGVATFSYSTTAPSGLSPLAVERIYATDTCAVAYCGRLKASLAVTAGVPVVFALNGFSGTPSVDTLDVTVTPP